LQLLTAPEDEYPKDKSSEDDAAEYQAAGDA
jgi:hypothetical protein